MLEMNIMKLAWLIYKNSKTIKVFSFALKYAWCIKRNKIKIFQNGTKVIFKGKSLKDYFLPTKGNEFKINQDDEYSINLFVEQARQIG